MALIRNGLGLATNPMKLMGSSVYVVRRAGWTQPGSMRGFYAGEATVINGASIADTAAFPNGYEAPYSWLLAPKGGGLSTYTSLEHETTLTSNLSSGINVDATMSATGDMTANMQALANLISTMSATGDMTANMQALANLAADMISNGDTTSTLQTIANMVATMTADGSLTTAELSLVVSLLATMSSDGSITNAPLTLLVALSCAMLSDCAVTAAVQATANLAASLVATGDIAGALSALANMITDMTSNGQITGVMRGTLDMEAIMTTEGSVEAPATPAEIAAAVWSAGTADYAAAGTFGEAAGLIPDMEAAVALIRQISDNRLEVNFSTQRLVLYTDDGTTVLRQWPLSTNGGESVATGTGVQTKRGVPV